MRQNFRREVNGDRSMTSHLSAFTCNFTHTSSPQKVLNTPRFSACVTTYSHPNSRMENPVKEISGVIHLLTQSPPSIQRETIETYFTPNASFTHPFCRTGSWGSKSGLSSRFLIQTIYRWYKIMSPNIDITVRSVAFDEPNLLLYVQIFQIFRAWIVPFYYAPVNLTTVITLQRNEGDGKYYIAEQNDLYQVDQFVKFVAPGSWVLVWLLQFWATFFCVLGTVAGIPITWVEENWLGYVGGNIKRNGKRQRGEMRRLDVVKKQF
ncbi:hypothetical protein P153DRAFT_4623 [Dothidotthia symphoricarpi CBS 119687]|uniref:SigF-like NTF2-like domain-containing protein n=1 Tax=Dothidotthia symphoricarpi CBS 119687 TaxID=1392245 RepID=A0A6A6ARY1_9PLEO|nr:uncharacterized protein P153DRAFT_4623 [Dothidotthia symphoricarpi CBS 119687]KAF2134560.1 hypothetical protein P153DRAFT_4623 [Dothidotthia symphoricarpi CBS 119687]